MAKRIARNTQIKLSKALVLNRWVLSQFGVDALESLAEPEFKRSVYEGLDADNHTHYYHYLLNRRHTFPGVTERQLLSWDQNIVSHTLQISEHRDAPIRWKYFQYLTLVFTELYFEWYFRDKQQLVQSLNNYIRRWNDGHDQSVRNESGFVCELFTEAELNKLAYWNATGSGKTLLMHINILQFLYYNRIHGTKDDLNKVLLITPNEGLSQQHLGEFADSGIDAEIFSKSSGSMFSGQKVEIIEISKLAEDSGVKSVAVDAFETNNLVLVDEGHRGAAGDEWKSRRDALSANGFAFEYSATFGQAVSAAAGPKKGSLLQEYSKSILMDYSYKYFHEDGYGKNYNILNIADDSKAGFVRKYLTGALLSYYQQLVLFSRNPQWITLYNIEKPLWVFVGGSVNKNGKLSERETTDVLLIIRFFSEFIKDGLLSRQHITEFLSNNDGIVDEKNRPVFLGRFNYLQQHPKPAEELYADILKHVFQTEVAGADIYVDQLKGQDGELGIRVGDHYFGVINVGDEASLFKLCQSHGIPGESKEFSRSLFHTIKSSDSQINLLIGSKKFTEGWSSWRVSTMGLMNIGRSEGSQIIQLFGRGVRLKGFQVSLKRSEKLDQDQRPATAIPKELNAVETLQIFGIRADYMQQFKEFLKEEGLPANDTVFQEIEIPVMITTNLGTIKLKVLQVKPGEERKFKEQEVVAAVYDPIIGRGTVRLEWYPKVQVMAGGAQYGGLPGTATQKLQPAHWAFIDWREVYFALQQHKAERRWHNLRLDASALPKILEQSDWYELAIPEGELEPTSFANVREWQEIITALLKGYVDRLYKIRQAGFLSNRMETIVLTPDHPNFMDTYRVEVEQSQNILIEQLNRINDLLKRAPLANEERVQDGLSVLEFMQHLYRPLIYLDTRKFKDVIRVSPVALVESEYHFVKHLKDFYEKNPAFFANRQLYLLRNVSRKGVGFFEANGFYPDFLLWLVEQDHQYITFVDPKGLRNINGMDNSKIQFHKTIKNTIEPKVREADPDVTLNAFIVTPTLHKDLQHWYGGERIADFNKHHVYFMNDQKDAYVGYMLEEVVRGIVAVS